MQGTMKVEKDLWKIVYGIVFLFTVWVFFSSNYHPERMTNLASMRWSALALLLCISLINNHFIVRKPLTLIWGYIVAVIPSLFVSERKTESITSFFLLLLLLYALQIISSEVIDIWGYVSLHRILFYFLFILTLLSVYFHMLGVDIDTFRATGVTTNSNTLGIFCYLSLIECFFMIRNGNRMERMFSLGNILVDVWLIFECGSRTALLMMVFLSGFFVFLCIKDSKWRVLSVIFLIAGLIFFVLLIKIFGSYALERMMSSEDGGGLSRGTIWQRGVDVWKGSPWFGKGFRVSRYYNIVEDNPWENQLDFHNSFLSFLVETGVWGVIFFGLPFIIHLLQLLKCFFREVKENKDSPYIYYCMLLGALFLSACTESYLFAGGATEAFLFWFVFMWTNYYVEQMRFWEADKGLEFADEGY